MIDKNKDEIEKLEKEGRHLVLNIKKTKREDDWWNRATIKKENKKSKEEETKKVKKAKEKCFSVTNI